MRFEENSVLTDTWLHTGHNLCMKSVRSAESYRQIYRGSYEAGTLEGLTLVPLEGVQVARLFAHDLNDSDGKELLVGTADGELLISYTKKSKHYVAAFYPALIEKLQQIQELVTQDAPELLRASQVLMTLAERQRIDRLEKQLDSFIAFIDKLQVDAAAINAARELADILNH